MYTELPADMRSHHPYHMYDEIKAQPAVIARSLSLTEAEGGEVRDALARARRVVLTGCGTSFHAAQAGAYALRGFTGGAVDAQAIGAYEMVTYYGPPSPDDVLIAFSHSGTTAMTVRALERARDAGALGVLITGFPDSAAGRAAGIILSSGYEDERSWAHTVSYTAAVAVITSLANSLARDDRRLDLSPLPDVVREALGLEEIAHRLAASVVTNEAAASPTPIFLIGGGPNSVTAREAALKLLETSYRPALPFELEESLHGPLAAVTPECLAVVIAPTGRSTDRAVGVVKALAQIEVSTIVLTGEDSAALFEDAHRFLLPEMPEVLSPLAYVVPLQVFSYFLSMGKGYNPDLIHRDDERYRNAAAATSTTA